MVTFELVLNFKTHGFQGILCNIIIFGGAYRYRRAACCLKQISSLAKYITLIIY